MENETEKMAEKFRKSKRPRIQDQGKKDEAMIQTSNSEITIYEHAVPSEKAKRNSSSSEDNQVNTSDEMMEVDIAKDLPNVELCPDPTLNMIINSNLDD